MHASPIIYRIDARDRISFVNEAWSEFARQNRGDEVMPGLVVGEVLWPFVGDETTRELYHRMVARARHGCTVQFRYRCDAPDERRVFEMIIRPAVLDEVEFHSQIVSRESRPPVPWLAPAAPRSRELVSVCSWCGRVALKVGAWVEIERAIEQHPAFQSSEVPRLTHGICPECRERMMRVINDPSPGDGACAGAQA